MPSESAVATAAQTLAYGATLRGDEAEFRVWAPKPRSITLKLWRSGREAVDVPMRRDGEDFVADVAAAAGDRYAYVVDGSQPVPDPLARG